MKKHFNTDLTHQELTSARGLEELGILKRRMALRMAAIGLLPHYRFGTSMNRIGFRKEEVLAFMRRSQTTTSDGQSNKGAA